LRNIAKSNEEQNMKIEIGDPVFGRVYFGELDENLKEPFTVVALDAGISREALIVEKAGKRYIMPRDSVSLPYITLTFEEVEITLFGSINKIQAKSYDFSQFGPLIEGSGDGWKDWFHSLSPAKKDEI
jgi:hypothetical protein